MTHKKVLAKREERRKKYEEYLLTSLFLNPRQMEERDRLIKERKERRDALKADILAKVLANMPDLHFRPCPWCGKEPHLEVGFYSNNYNEIPDEYYIEMHTCDCLYSGSHLNTYPITEIPKEPLYPNPNNRWDTGWNGSMIPFEEFPIEYDESVESNKKDLDDKHYRSRVSGKLYSFHDLGHWGSAVNEHIKFLSDEWPYQCCQCHKKWRGYESCGDEVIVDNRSYCKKCSPVYWWDKDGKYHLKEGTYGDPRDLSSLYIQDSAPVYYTS